MPTRRPGPAAMTAPDRSARAIMDALRRVVRALRQSARLTETSLGISAAQLFVLHQLADEGGLSITTLAERTLTDQSSVSLVVTRLAERGLVARRSARDDRRRTVVELTAAGRRLLEQAPEATQVRLLGGLTSMTAADRKALARLLGTLVAAVEQTDAVPPMFFEDEVAAATRAGGARRRTRRAR